MIPFCSGLEENTKDEESTKTDDFPLAVKMMFNYDVESNSAAILRSMYRELVPFQSVETSSFDFLENDKLYGVVLPSLLPCRFAIRVVTKTNSIPFAEWQIAFNAYLRTSTL